MQMTHHGMVTDNDVRMMNTVKPSTILWPCSETKFNLYWGLNCTGKQWAIANVENLIHGCGSATRPLSYVGKREEGTPVPLTDLNVIAHHATLQTSENGIAYRVTSTEDPYVAFETEIDTTRYNALRVTVKCADFRSCSLYWTSGSQTPMTFTDANCKPLGPQGASVDNGYVTLIVYLGNGEDFTGNITSLRIDLGTAVGQSIEIAAIEAYWMQLDEIAL